MKLITVMLLISLAYPATSFAAIQIMATRVILDAKEKEQSFVIRNTGEVASLLQIWLSDKDNSGMNIDKDLPLVITPPIARINVNKSKVFRFFPTDEALTALPQDRESVFWINALDVPAITESEEDKNKLNIAFRTRIKAFYRPANMKGSVIEAGDNLTWQVKKTSKEYTYTVTNNSPFNISFASLSLTEGEKEVALLPGDMVAPFSTKNFIFKDVKAQSVTLNYQYITDLGAFVPKAIKL